MTRQTYRERECIHRDEGAEGDYYNGAFYLQALQRLRVDAAVKMAGKASSFFWSDAQPLQSLKVKCAIVGIAPGAFIPVNTLPLTIRLPSHDAHHFPRRLARTQNCN